MSSRPSLQLPVSRKTSQNNIELREKNNRRSKRGESRKEGRKGVIERENEGESEGNRGRKELGGRKGMCSGPKGRNCERKKMHNYKVVGMEAKESKLTAAKLIDVVKYVVFTTGRKGMVVEDEKGEEEDWKGVGKWTR